MGEKGEGGQIFISCKRKAYIISLRECFGEPRLDILKQIAIPFLLAFHRSIITATSIMLGGIPSIHRRIERRLSTFTESPSRRRGNQRTFRCQFGRHDDNHLHMKHLCLQPLMQRPGPSAGIQLVVNRKFILDDQRLCVSVFYFIRSYRYRKARYWPWIRHSQR